MAQLIPLALVMCATVSAILSTTFAVFALRVIKADRQEYEANKALFGSDALLNRLVRSIKGEASVLDGRSDYFRLHAGLAMDLKKKNYIKQGRPSKEAVRSIYESVGR